MTMTAVYPNFTESEWKIFGNNAENVLGGATPPVTIPTEIMTPFSAAASAYSAAYTAAVEPATRSKPKVQAKDTALVELKAASRPLVSFLQNSNAVSDELRTQLSIKVYDRRPSRTYLPKWAPTQTAALTGPQSLRLEVRDPAEPDRRAKPSGAKSIVVQTYRTIGGELPPSDLTTWPIETFSGKSRIDLYFGDLTNQATVWVSCYWLGKAQERGLSSTPTSVTLPGMNLQGAQLAQVDDGQMRIAA